jgi:drug/metabolite transporter (DMT)-like permease
LSLNSDKKSAVAQQIRARAAPKLIAPGFLLALGGSIAFSGKAIIVKLAYRYGVDAVTLIMLRMLFALPLFLLMVWWATYRQSGDRPPLAWRDWLGVVWLGFTGYYLASYLDFAGLAYISASLERLILYLNPTIVMLLGLAFYKRRISSGQVFGMGISYAGVVLVFGHELWLQGPGQIGGTARGALLVLISAICYAVYLVHSGEMVKRLGSLRLVGWASVVACLFCIGQFLLLRPISSAMVVPEVIWLSVLNATLCTAAPVLMIMMAIERVGASVTAQTGMVGPMSTILMGVVILGEPLTVWVVAGTALVLTGIYVFTQSRR